jgi:hypothetical protein
MPSGGSPSTNAEQEILDRARVMLETARAMRIYTTTQIAPLPDREQSRLTQVDNCVDQVLNVRIPEAKGGRPSPDRARTTGAARSRDQIVEGARKERQEVPRREFLPQSIRFYAASEAFNYFPRQYPDYAT